MMHLRLAAIVAQQTAACRNPFHAHSFHPQPDACMHASFVITVHNITSSFIACYACDACGRNGNRHATNN